MQWSHNTCRICGQISDTCHLIWAKSPNDIENKIKKCLKLELFKDDFKPKQLCNPCLLKLDDFYQFLMICHATDQKFESILMNRQEWGPETILDYTQQKMSVIVSNKGGLEHLECNEIDLYKESVLPLETCPEMLDIVENANYMPENLDYLNPNYGMKKFHDFYQEPGVLRHSSNYPQEAAINYSCQQETFPDLSYPNVGLDYSNYAPQPNFAEAKAEPSRKPPASQKTFPCPHCEKKFKRRVTLNAHIAIHTKIRPYICDICKKSYAIKCDLTNHLKIHAGRNKCKYCSSAFPAPSKLQRHLRTHTKDRPFVCDFKNCGKSFSDKRNLDGHKALHSNEFNFKCQECGRAFRTKNRLKQHEKAHTVATPYVCEICSKAYKYKSTLIFHLKKHNGYFCPYCEKDCEKAVKLLRHKKVCAVARNKN
ncbi:zinc finger protein 267 [Tribolium castaneum]|uniref:zinc finger protein 267 n=1 Tax=Tribolium castaneum TaxID=7070 RepID=UPI0030FED6B0